MGIDNCTGEAEPSFSDIQLHTARYPCCSVARLHVFVLCSRLGMHEQDQICSPNTDPERIAQLPRCCNLLFSISRMRACHICEFEQQCGCHVIVRRCILIVHPVHPVKSRTLCWSFDAVFFICGEGGVSELSGHPFGHILVCSEPSSGFPDKLCYVLRSKAILNTMQCSEYTQTKFILRWFFLASNVCLFVYFPSLSCIMSSNCVLTSNHVRIPVHMAPHGWYTFQELLHVCGGQRTLADPLWNRALAMRWTRWHQHEFALLECWIDWVHEC